MSWSKTAVLLLSFFAAVQKGSALKVAQTFYGFPDNDPAGPGILLDCGRGHEASGTGTFNDPLTFATAPGQFEDCEIICDPTLKKYLIHEDYCQACDTDWSKGLWHIDVWVGQKNYNGAGDQISCENRLTSPPQKYVVRDPDPDLPVDTTPLYEPGRFCKADQAGYYLSLYEYNDQDFTKYGAANQASTRKGQPKPPPPPPPPPVNAPPVNPPPAIPAPANPPVNVPPAIPPSNPPPGIPAPPVVPPAIVPPANAPPVSVPPANHPPVNPPPTVPAPANVPPANPPPVNPPANPAPPANVPPAVITPATPPPANIPASNPPAIPPPAPVPLADPASPPSANAPPVKIPVEVPPISTPPAKVPPVSDPPVEDPPVDTSATEYSTADETTMQTSSTQDCVYQRPTEQDSQGKGYQSINQSIKILLTCWSPSIEATSYAGASPSEAGI